MTIPWQGIPGGSTESGLVAPQPGPDREDE